MKDLGILDLVHSAKVEAEFFYAYSQMLTAGTLRKRCE
jgi:hypothetical protein